MAQTIQIANATYPDVPSIVCNKQGGGTAIYADPSGTTAVAADVAQGKWFLTDQGVLTQGTASGGGGTFVPKMGVIRPDATLVKSWTYDKQLVRDESVTIPAYSTSAKTLLSSQSLTQSVDTSSYDYFIFVAGLITPIYNTAAVAKGRLEHWMGVSVFEYTNTDKSLFVASTGKNIASNTASTVAMYSRRLFYWSSGTSYTQTSSSSYVSYGVYFNGTHNMSISNGTLTVSISQVSMRGNASYFSQTYWEAMTDARVQYIAAIYSVPRTTADTSGWSVNMLTNHLGNAANNGGAI